MVVADDMASAIGHWLGRQEVAFASPIEIFQIAGGRSNLTYRIVDGGGHSFVLRRPPTGQVLETAHSMNREWRFIRALHGTGVPVPRPIAFCDDPAILGVSFYVMEHVDGLVLHTADNARALSSPARTAVSARIAATLARLHAVDVEAVGLSDIGRGADYVARQLRRWHGQWDKTRTAASLDIPVIDEGHRVLEAAVPEQRSAGIVHGDFRLGNVVTGWDGTIRAVLDWELATLGDPRADLGWLLLSWDERAAPSRLPGFGSRAELIESYSRAAGENAAADIDFFVAFAAWRWACISAGVYARYQAGVMGGENADLPAILEAIRNRAEYALDVIAGRHTLA
jgi:aminoglycoside phosphotransferase (APT) family kinase protein